MAVDTTPLAIHPSNCEIGFPEKDKNHFVGTPEIGNDLARFRYVTYREATTTDFGRRSNGIESEKITDKLDNAYETLTPLQHQISKNMSRSNNLSLSKNSKLAMNTSHAQDANVKRPIETFENVYNYKSFPFTPKDMPQQYQDQIEPDFQVCEGKYATSFDERHCLTVYEYKINGQWIMWDHYSGYVHLTGMWKAVGNSKADIVKLIDNSPDLEPLLRRVRGGFLKIQGTWIPYEAAVILARRTCYDIRYALIPVFGPDFPDACLTPEDEDYGLLKLSLPPGTITSSAAHSFSQKGYGGSDAFAKTATLGIADNGSGVLMTTINDGISDVNHDRYRGESLSHPKMSRATKLNFDPNKNNRSNGGSYLSNKDRRGAKKTGKNNIDADGPRARKIGRPREGVVKKRRSSSSSKYIKKSGHRKRASDPTGYAMPDTEHISLPSQYAKQRKNSLDSAESIGSLSPSEPRTPRTFPFDFRLPDGSPKISNEPQEFLQMLKATWGLLNLSSGNERNWNPSTEGPLKIDCGGQCWIWDGDDSLYLLKNHNGDEAPLDQRMATISLYDCEPSSYEGQNAISDNVFARQKPSNFSHQIEPAIAYDNGMRSYIYDGSASKDTAQRYPNPLSGTDDYYLAGDRHGEEPPSHRPPHTYSEADTRCDVYGYGEGYAVPRYAPLYYGAGHPAPASLVKEAEYNRVNAAPNSQSKMNIGDLLS